MCLKSSADNNFLLQHAHTEASNRSISGRDPIADGGLSNCEAYIVGDALAVCV